MLDYTVVQAIYDMTKGATLLKGSRGKRTKGKMHHRHVSLSKDLTHLQWESARKDKEESILHISQMGDLKYAFTGSSSHLNQESESLAFSVVYFEQPLQGKTLDFVCKDKQQYQTWTTGLQALIHGFKDKEVVWELMKNAGELKAPYDERRKVDQRAMMGSLKNSPHEDKIACHLFSWGDGTKGMLGHGEDTEEHTPHLVLPLLGWEIQMVACGAAHTIALSTNGTVFSWGSGSGGRLGQGHLRDRYTPIQIKGLADKHIVEVACNEFHSAAISSAGELFTWGKDNFRLGYPCTERRQVSPRVVESLKDILVAHVACGLNHTIGNTRDGKLFVFGDNEFGQLGTGDRNCRDLPVFPDVYELQTLGVSAVSCGRYHSAANAVRGTCWFWGLNDCGQLGTGDEIDYDLPTKLTIPGIPENEKKDQTDTSNASLRNRDLMVSSVSCGGKHSAVLTRKGVLITFGGNSYGQLGIKKMNEQEMHSNAPVPVCLPAEEKVSTYSCGGSHTALVTESGKLYTMGKGACGRLGDGEDVTKLLPTLVESLSGKNVLSVSCGATHTACAVAPSSLKDEEYCMLCRQRVGGFKRKHQCKKCYGMFCIDCCSKKLMAVKGSKDAARVCNKCYTLLTKVQGISV